MPKRGLAGTIQRAWSDRRGRQALALLVVLVLVGTGAFALYDALTVQPSGVAGTVASADGSPVVGAAVVPRPLSAVPLLASGDSFTDSQGNYRLLLPPGVYNIDVVAGDALLANQQIEVRPQQITKMDLTIRGQ